MIFIENLAKKLKTHGLKITPQRLAIYGYLKATCKHPSVEQIYKDIKDEHSRLSIATVYKTVASLEESGLIRKLNINGTYRYDANTSFHIHIVCGCCGGVYDCSEDKLFDLIEKNINEKTGFKPEYAQIFIYGKCSKCN